MIRRVAVAWRFCLAPHQASPRHGSKAENFGNFFSPATNWCGATRQHHFLNTMAYRQRARSASVVCFQNFLCTFRNFCSQHNLQIEKCLSMRLLKETGSHSRNSIYFTAILL
jgi:hypothetical protein